MTGPRVAVVRRVLPAPPAVVFDEWLDPVGMTEWMCWCAGHAPGSFG